MLDFRDKKGTRFSLRDKCLFEISEIKVTKVDCIKSSKSSSLFKSDYWLLVFALIKSFFFFFFFFFFCDISHYMTL